MSYLPIELSLALKEHFFFPEKPLFGAVATVQQHTPRIRTMRIYEIDGEGCPILLTHVASNKWKEFQESPQACINVVSENKLVQLIVQGHLQLKSAQNDKALHYWNLVRPDVKKIYDPKHTVGAPFSQAEVLTIPESVPESFGMARLLPEFWELLLLASDYPNSERYQFKWRENRWQKQRIHVG